MLAQGAVRLCEGQEAGDEYAAIRISAGNGACTCGCQKAHHIAPPQDVQDFNKIIARLCEGQETGDRCAAIGGDNAAVVSMLQQQHVAAARRQEAVPLFASCSYGGPCCPVMLRPNPIDLQNQWPQTSAAETGSLHGASQGAHGGTLQGAAAGLLNWIRVYTYCTFHVACKGLRLPLAQCCGLRLQIAIASLQ